LFKEQEHNIEAMNMCRLLVTDNDDDEEDPVEDPVEDHVEDPVEDEEEESTDA
jgi:hypothetical protein